tara:strand:- start:597 stop:1352 length:756 start_codon:yes stop_codon:yes gene_type:complete
MNWFKKISSVTFIPAGTHGVAQPMNLLDLSSDLLQFAIKNQVVSGRDNSVDVDGDWDWVSGLGIINFYLTDDATIEDVKRVVDAYNESQAGQVYIQVGRQEKSGMMAGDVVRLNVVKNTTSDREEVPEINMANANAYKIMQVLKRFGLNIEDIDNGCIDVDDYLGARQLMTDQTLKEHEQKFDMNRDWDQMMGTYQEPEPWEQSEPEEPTPENVHGPDFDLNRMNQYLSRLDGIAQWTIDNDLPDRRICWS